VFSLCLLEYQPEFLRRANGGPGVLIALYQFEYQMDTTMGGAKSFRGISTQAHG
jgi:hypothetical protein